MIVKNKLWNFGLGLLEERKRRKKDVADMLGISQSYISRLEKRIIKKDYEKEFNKMV